ncbi:uncharacterized protein LOC142819551 [Pelodiscus sinensis]|uniref:uncharacterized protein LOC142819551 n=1 Tax=Pelodiscus sinensis TaxID=13735 RepID=UPI003F6D06CF
MTGSILVLGGAGQPARPLAGGGGPPRDPLAAPHGPGARSARPLSPGPRTSPGKSQGAAPGLRVGQRGPGGRSRHLPPLRPAPCYPRPANPASPRRARGQQNAPPPSPGPPRRGKETASSSEDEASIATQQAPSCSPDISRTSSEAGEGSTAGPSTSRGLSSTAAAAPSAAQPHRHRLHQQDQLLRRHVLAVECSEASIRQRIQGDLQWRQQAWVAFQAQCTRMADSITTLTAHIAHAIHYGMALPHAPAIPPLALPMPPPAPAMPPPAAPAMPPPAPAMPPPAAPAMPSPAAPAITPPAHLPVQPALMQPAPHVQVHPHRSTRRGHPSQE